MDRMVDNVDLFHATEHLLLPFRTTRSARETLAVIKNYWSQFFNMPTDESILIMQLARQAGLNEMKTGAHLSSRISVLNYIRIADEIKATLGSGRVLDWGCGAGQMSFLLRRRKLETQAYDIGDHAHSAASSVFRDITISINDDPVKIPYPDESFDAVLSCGVLEHVPDEKGSLGEIHRVLKPSGLFFVYNLPQRWSYKEFLIEKMRGGYTHERKYHLNGTIHLLQDAGFDVSRTRRSGMLPQNMTPFPRWRQVYNRMARPFFMLDRALSAIPGLNLFGEALELVAIKKA
jgi:ubiquinone/menaquinone biosynthesis C-methylase UbiE